jgi:hypothetical protein
MTKVRRRATDTVDLAELRQNAVIGQNLVRALPKQDVDIRDTKLIGFYVRCAPAVPIPTAWTAAGSAA